MPRAPLIFLSGALVGVCGTLLAGRQPKGGAASALDAHSGGPAPGRRTRASTVPRLTWVSARPGGTDLPRCAPPTRQECDKVIHPAVPAPGTPEYYRFCATADASACSFVDLHQETLDEIARCGTFRSDVPIFEMAQFDVTDAEKGPLREAARAYALRLKATVIEIGKQLGTPYADNDTVDENMNRIERFIQDRTDYPSMTLWKQIARERAGWLPKQPPDTGPPEERYWRLLASIGDDFEAALAAALGPRRAHELRLDNNGWPLRHLGLNVCDGEEEDSAN
jgi:hypothetical protein